MSEKKQEQKLHLPEIEDGSWILSFSDKKYKLREASLQELADASVGARSEREEQIRLLGLTVTEQQTDGSWKPIEWPKGGADRLFKSLQFSYMTGLVALGIETKKSSQPLTEKTTVADASNVSPGQ